MHHLDQFIREHSIIILDEKRTVGQITINGERYHIQLSTKFLWDLSGKEVGLFEENNIKRMKYSDLS